MNGFRKIIIGMVSAGVVVLAFVIYTNMSPSTEIKQSDNRTGEVLERPDFTGSSKFEDSGIGGVDNAEFFKRDEVTRKIRRIFGFEKLLNPERNSEKWRLQKPYMQFFGDDFKCKIVSDEGNFQIEKVMNDISPQNARLYGNVRLELTFENEGVPTNGVIYLEDLDYDSERSELATDKSVRAVFDDAVMEGTGMVLIYNAAKGRIEYFEMKDLDFIRIKDVASMSKDRKGGKTAKVEKSEKSVKGAKSIKGGETSQVADAGEVAGASVEAEVAKSPPVAQAVDDKVAGGQGVVDAVVEEVGDFYHCRFLKDVTIEYGNELVVIGHEELNIINLLFSQSAPDEASSDKPAGGVDGDKVESKEVAVAVADKPAVAAKAEGSVSTDASGAVAQVASVDAADGPIAESGDASVETTEVVLTCKNGFVVQLMSNIDMDTPRGGPVAMSLDDTLIAFLDEAEKANAGNSESEKDLVEDGLIYADAAAEFADLPLDVEYANFAADGGDASAGAAVITKPTRFHATKIDYDMSAKYAYATGPIDLLIYAKPDPNGGPDQEQVPINITAEDNCEYFGFKDQVVFNGEVVGMQKVTEELFVTENSVHGDQFVVDLDSVSDESPISHLSVLGENVMMFATRKAEDEILSLVRLECERIDYYAADEFVEAMGPGVIEIDNSNAPVVESSDAMAKPEDNAKSEADAGSKVTLKEPCYGRVLDFDSLKWYSVANKIVVDGHSDSVKIQHIPVVDGQYGKITYVAARKIEANFVTTPLGRTELSGLTASDTVLFKETDGEEDINLFIGDNLFYNVAESLMLITGTEGNPCEANGFATDKISYNLATGELVTGISGVATIQLPPEPKK